VDALPSTISLSKENRLNHSEHTSALVYLNGEFLPYDQAAFAVDDRGMMFGDGVYEVLNYWAGRAFLPDEHMARLRSSMRGIALPEPAGVTALPHVTAELMARQNMDNARVYWQVTRGAAPRAHLPPVDPQPTVLAIATAIEPWDADAPPRQLSAMVCDDRRWADCWIKSLMLLPNTLAKAQAHRAGCQEAILQRDGVVTEGTVTNVIIVADGKLRTHPLNGSILPGLTRQLVLDLAREQQQQVEEQPFTVNQMLQADEVMLTGTTTHIAAVTQIDGRRIGAGTTGPVTRQLYDAYAAMLGGSRCLNEPRP
jgi:D-alanine transaminase